MAKLDPIKSTPYLSVVEGRKPRQKTHTTLSHAKNAFDPSRLNKEITHPKYRGFQSTHGWGEIYEFKDGEWQLLYEIPQPTQDDLVVTEKSWGKDYKWETRPWRKNDD